MNDTSMTASSIGSPSVSAVSVRAFVRSWTTTRGSRAMRSASWPRPTSTAWTRAAPRWSRTSVKPPVDAPDVEADEPGRIDPERVERRRELVAAAADVRIALDKAERRGRVDEIAGLPIEARPVALPDPDLAGEDQRLGPRAGLGEAALDEELVEARRRAGSDVEVGLTRLSWHSRLRRGSPRHAAAASRSARARRPPEARLSPSVASVSRTWAASPAASSRSRTRRSRDRAVVDEPLAGDADDPDRDLAQRRVRRGAPPRSPRGRRAPKPPVTTLSSNVTTSCLPRAWSRISSRSSGFANRALMTPIDQPSTASSVGGLERPGDDRPEPDEQQVAPLAKDLASPDRDRTAGSTGGSPKPGSRG